MKYYTDGVGVDVDDEHCCFKVEDSIMTLPNSKLLKVCRVWEVIAVCSGVVRPCLARGLVGKIRNTARLDVFNQKLH